MKTDLLKQDIYISNHVYSSDKEGANILVRQGLLKSTLPKLLDKIWHDGEYIISMSDHQNNADEIDATCIRVVSAFTKLIRCRDCINRPTCKNYMFFGNDGYCSWGE